MNKKSVKGILFDFDGVLGKTMEDHYRAWRQVFSDLGVAIRSEDYFLLEGLALEKIADLFLKFYHLDPALSLALVKKKEDSYLKNHRFEFYSGVEALVDRLKINDIPLAIVSAGRRERLEHSVPKDFLEKFDVLIAGDALGRGKPYPDGYLKAAGELNISISNCLVIENAPLGIEAAKSAGAYCIAISSTLDRDKLKGADLVIDKFTDLENVGLIKNLIPKPVYA